MYDCLSSCQPYLSYRASFEKKLRDQVVVRDAETICEVADCKQKIVSLPFDDEAKEELQRSLDGITASLESINDSLLALELAQRDIEAVECPGPGLDILIGRHACYHPAFQPRTT